MSIRKDLAGALALAVTFLGCSAAQDHDTTRAGAEHAAAASTSAGIHQVRPVVFPPVADYLARDYRGRQVVLRRSKGKVVLLNFWATWCPPCRYEIPDFIQLRKAYSPLGRGHFRDLHRPGPG